MPERTTVRVRTETVRVPRRDGVALAADVHLPASGGPFPVLVMRLPYDRAVAQSYWYAPPQWYAQRGYAVVVEDMRGRCGSGGVFAPLVHEAADGEDLVSWVLDQPWCDGAIGMYGYSYAAYAQLLAATSDVADRIGAVAPALAFTSLGEGCLRSAGATAAGFLLTWAEQLGGLRLPDASLPDLVARPLASFAPGIVDEHRDWVSAWLREDAADPYWDGLPRPDYGRLRAKTLFFGGWYDTFRRDAFAHRAAAVRAGASAGLVVGPWSHTPYESAMLGEPIRPSARSWNVDLAQLRLFDAALRGEGEAPTGVRLAIMNSDSAWEADQWPPAHRVQRVRWLSATGDDLVLADEPPTRIDADMLRADPARQVIASGGDDCGDPTRQGMGAALQGAVEAHPDVLVYTGRPVARETTLVGEAAVELHVECEGPAQLWIARLALVLDDERSVNLVEGVLRTGLDAGVHRVRVELGELAVRLQPGQRLRLHLAGTCAPRWAPVPRPTVARVLRGPETPSRLVLDVAA